jgi:hypothetical protein
VERATNSRAASLGPTVYWRAVDTHHVLALRTDPVEFQRRIEAFLAMALSPRETPEAAPAATS